MHAKYKNIQIHSYLVVNEVGAPANLSIWCTNPPRAPRFHPMLCTPLWYCRTRVPMPYFSPILLVIFGVVVLASPFDRRWTLLFQYYVLTFSTLSIWKSRCEIRKCSRQQVKVDWKVLLNFDILRSHWNLFKVSFFYCQSIRQNYLFGIGRKEKLHWYIITTGI